MTCSLCGADAPHSHLPLLPPEVRAARAEDPSFAEVMGRAKAKARGQEYVAERDYPYRPVGARHTGGTEPDPRLAALLERWSTRGERPRWLTISRGGER